MTRITGRISLLSIALMTALACTTAAKANTFSYDFTLTDGHSNTYNLTETITATFLGGGYYGITAVNGTVINGGPIPLDGNPELYDWTGSGGYGAPGNFYKTAYDTTSKNYMAFDNILNLAGSGPIFSLYGEFITFGGGTYYINLFYNPDLDISTLNPYPGYSWYAVQKTGTNTYTTIDAGTFDIDSGPVNPATPEPSTWMLLGSGLFALTGLALRSRRAGLILHS